MSGNSLRDQLSELALARQKQRELAQKQDEKKKAPVDKEKSKQSEKQAPDVVTKRDSASISRAKLTPMPGLPVSERAKEIIEAIKKNRVLILCGETGSGKTTQLPKLCVLAGRGRRGKIAHTQPRRIAASSIARRLAEETGTELGQWVGFKIRFTDKTEPGAKVKMMTDGINDLT